MSDLTDAREALAAAKAAHAEAHAAEQGARAAATSLRQRLASGTGADVAPSGLTQADAVVERARLLTQAAEEPIEALTATVRTAQSDADADAVVGTLPVLVPSSVPWGRRRASSTTCRCSRRARWQFPLLIEREPKGTAMPTDPASMIPKFERYCASCE
jgi:hypothetical protein